MKPYVEYKYNFSYFYTRYGIEVNSHPHAPTALPPRKYPLSPSRHWTRVEIYISFSLLGLL